MLFLYIQLWLDDTLRWVEEIMRDGINSTIITVVFSAILAVVVAVIIWVIRSRQLPTRVQVLLIHTLKLLNQPIHDREKFVLDVVQAQHKLWQLRPTYTGSAIKEFFETDEAQRVLFVQHPFVNPQGIVRFDVISQHANQIQTTHAAYIEEVANIYGAYRQKRTASERRAMPQRSEFAYWWTVALLYTIEQQFTTYERLVQVKLDEIEAQLRKIASFESRISAYFRIVNTREYVPASANTVQAFYRGQSMLTWEIVSAGAVVARQQRSTFIEQYGSNVPTQFELVCVTGEMGEGKTTFLWDAALEIARNLDCLLVQCMVLDPAAWGTLASAVNEDQRPVVVLVDDVFTSESFKQAMYATGQVNLPIRVLATSRSYDLPKYDLFTYEQVPLKSPTRPEIDGLLDKFGQSALNQAQRSRLYSITSWLVLMMELSSGNEFENVIRQSLEYLRNQDPTHYLAFIYVCFVSQYNLAIPRDLLSAIRSEFRNIQIPGYIFDTETTSAGSLVRAVHTQIAIVVVQHAKITHDFCDILSAFCSTADFRKQSHRYMIGMLGAAMVRRNEFEQYKSLFELSQPHIQQWFAQCTHVEVFNQITTILYALKAESELTVLHRRMLAQEPQTISDWRSLLMYVERTKQRVIFNVTDALKRFAQSEQQDAGVWDLVVLYLIAHPSNQFAAQQLIPLIAEVISRGQLIRAQYLELVERFGSNKQCEAAITHALGWIEHSHGAPQLAIAYTRLIIARGTVQMKQQAVVVLAKYVPLDDAFAKVHPELFQYYLRLLQDMNKTHEISQILHKVTELIRRPEWNMFIVRKYILLVDLVGTSDDKNQAIAQMTIAVGQHGEDVTSHMMRTIWKMIDELYLRNAARYAGTLKTSDILHAFLQTVPAWLVRNPNAYSQSLYLRAINKSNNHVLSTQALQYFQQWLGETPIEQIDIIVFTGYCQLLSRNHTSESHYELVLRIAEYMFGEHVEDAYIRSNVAQMLLKHTAYIAQPSINATAIRIAIQIVLWINEHDVDVRLRKTLLMLALQCTKERELCIRVLQSTLQWYQKSTEVSSDTELLHMLVTLSVYIQDKVTIQAMIPTVIQIIDLYYNSKLFVQVYEMVQKYGTPEHQHTIAEKLYERLCNDPTDEGMLVYVLQLARTSKLTPFITKVLGDQFNWLLIHIAPPVQHAYLQLVEENINIANPAQVTRIVTFWKRRGLLSPELEATFRKLRMLSN